jgi:hypothetical protein
VLAARRPSWRIPSWPVPKKGILGLRSDYTWAGIKAYHFSFHRDKIASNAGRFDPSTWRTLDGNRVFATCVPAYLRAETQHRDDQGPSLHAEP